MRHIAIFASALAGALSVVGCGEDLQPKHEYDCRQRVERDGGMCNDCADRDSCTLECPDGAGVVSLRREHYELPNAWIARMVCHVDGDKDAAQNGPGIFWQVDSDGSEWIISSGWWVDGDLHGPAVDYFNNEPTEVQWYENGELVSEEDLQPEP